MWGACDVGGCTCVLRLLQASESPRASSRPKAEVDAGRPHPSSSSSLPLGVAFFGGLGLDLGFVLLAPLLALGALLVDCCLPKATSSASSSPCGASLLLLLLLLLLLDLLDAGVRALDAPTPEPNSGRGVSLLFCAGVLSPPSCCCPPALPLSMPGVCWSGVRSCVAAVMR